VAVLANRRTDRGDTSMKSVRERMDESDRESWRLHLLRGWSNAKEIPLFARGA
jgi:hypothetical protein